MEKLSVIRFLPGEQAVVDEQRRRIEQANCVIQAVLQTLAARVGVEGVQYELRADGLYPLLPGEGEPLPGDVATKGERS